MNLYPLTRLLRDLRRRDVFSLTLSGIDAVLALSRRRTGRDGFLYVAAAPATPGLLKIGYSRNPSRRMRELTTTGVAYRYALVATLATPDMRRDEAIVHGALAPFRVGDRRDNGALPEVFALDAERAVALMAEALGREPQAFGWAR